MTALVFHRSYTPFYVMSYYKLYKIGVYCVWKGVSRDAEHNGEVQNGFTSCFASQTGSASIFLNVID